MADRIILPRATDDNFAIVAGAEAYFYDTGTTSEQTVYSDEAGTVPVSQPLTADAEGVFAATFATSPVKVVVKDPSGVTLPGYPSDPHPKVPASGSSADEVSFSPITGNAATNVQAAIQSLTTLWNNVTTFGKTLIAAANKAAARVVLGIGNGSPGQGDVLYYNGADYPGLALGTEGQFLKAGASAPEWATPTFSESYASTGQTMTAGGLITLAHGLSSIPKVISLYAKCTSADSGYSVNDILDLSAAWYPDSATSTTRGGAVRKDATNIYIRVGADPFITTLTEDGTARTGLDATKWDLYVEAYA